MADRNTLSQATKQDLENAQTKGQVIGWGQAFGVMMILGLVLKFVGLMPLIAVGGVVAYLGYKVLFGGKTNAPS